MARDDRRARMRMEREDVQRTAKVGSAFGGERGTFLTLPEGVESFAPEKVGTYLFRVVPFEVTAKGHGDKIAVGKWHYRRPFGVHQDVGGSGEAVLCTRETFGIPDIICNKCRELAKSYEENKEAIKAIQNKRYCAFLIILVKTPDGVVYNPKEVKFHLYADKYSKFAKVLEKKLSTGEPEDLDFGQADEGKLLKVAYTEEDFGGHKYLQAFSIEFADAKGLTDLSDDIIDAIPDVDSMFVTTDPAHIAELFDGGEEGGAAGEIPSGDEWDNDNSASGKPAGKVPGKKAPATTAADDWDTGGGEGEGEGAGEGEPELEPEKPSPKTGKKAPAVKEAPAKPGKKAPAKTAAEDDFGGW